MSIYVIKRNSTNIGYAYTEYDALDIVNQLRTEAVAFDEARQLWLEENPEPESNFTIGTAAWDAWNEKYHFALDELATSYLMDNWVDRWSLKVPEYIIDRLEAFELEYELTEAPTEVSTAGLRE